MWKKIIREFKMLGKEALMEFLKKILPDETDEEKIKEQAHKLALRKPEKSESGYLLIDPMENKGNSRYEKEKINKRLYNSEVKSEPYSTFDKMRNLVKKDGIHGNWYFGETDTFIKQAKFMEKFTDNTDKFYPMKMYYTTYNRMDDNQLRTYFTWRNQVRKGNVINVSTSYFYCYSYELINEIGTVSYEDTIEKLINIWTEFRKFDESVDSYLRSWVRDYYIINHNNLLHSFSYYRDLLPISYYSFEPQLYSEMMEFKWDKLKAVEIFSSFRITDGQFYKSGNQVIIEECACYVLKKLAVHLKKAGVDIKKLFTARQREDIYSFFRGALCRTINFYEQAVTLDGIETYKFNGKSRKIEGPDICKYKAIVGYILKLIEVNMRKRFGSKRSLQPPAIKQVEKCLFNNRRDYGYYGGSHISDLSIWKRKLLETMYEDSFEETIIQAISDYLKEKNIVIKNGKIEIIKPIEIDLSKIKKIEKDHIETAKKLILEEDIERDESISDFAKETITDEDNKPEIDNLSEMEAKHFDNAELSGCQAVINALSNEAKDLILHLANGEKTGSNYELLVEEINEKALEITGDNLIEYVSGEPQIYEDYLNEVKEAVGGR